MADVVRTEQLREAERRLQAAQLASDVAALDELLDDRLVFTGPDGRLYSKADDLEVHLCCEDRPDDFRQHCVEQVGQPVDAPLVNYVPFGRSWQVGIDVANHGGGRDLVLAARYDIRKVNDLVTTASSVTVTSATQAQFGPEDNGRAISGTGIPAAATLVWVSGTDSMTSARLSAAATATATGVTATIGTGSTVNDIIYVNDNGGNPASVGIGFTPPDKNYRLQVATAGAAGGLRIARTAGETGSPKLATFQDQAGTDRLWLNNDFTWQGLNTAYDGSVVIKGDATNLRPLSFVHPTSNQTTGFYFADNTKLTLRSFTAGVDLLELYGDGSVRHVSSKLAFYAATPATKQTVTGSRGGNAALASLLTALATSYGLVIDSSTA